MHYHLRFQRLSQDERAEGPPPLWLGILFLFNLCMMINNAVRAHALGPVSMMALLGMVLLTLGYFVPYLLPRRFQNKLFSFFIPSFDAEFTDEAISVEMKSGVGILSDDRVTWQEFAKKGLFTESLKGFAFRYPVRKQSFDRLWYIPKRIFASNTEVEQFRQDVLDRLRSESPVEERPRFEFDFDTTADDDLPLSWSGKLGRTGLRWGAVVVFPASILALMDSQSGIADRIGAILLLSCSVTFLILPQTVSEKFVRRVFGVSKRSQIRICNEFLGVTRLTARQFDLLYGDGDRMEWSALAESGEFEESSDAFLLEYPRKRGRIPNHSCWIPKRAFDSDEQIDEFRSFVRAKMRPAPLIVNRLELSTLLPSPN